MAANNVTSVAVDNDKIQEKLTAISDASKSKAVLAGATVRSVGDDNSLAVARANNVINHALEKDKIQEKLTAGELPSESQTRAVFL